MLNNQPSQASDRGQEKKPVSFLTYGWAQRLYRIQLSFDKQENFLERNGCFQNLKKFITSLENEFCDKARNSIETARGKKFELDNFHVMRVKEGDTSRRSIIEVFKQERVAHEDFKEMGRKKLRNTILTADEVKIVLEGSNKIDTLNEKQIASFLAYIQSLKLIVSDDSRALLETIEQKLISASQVKIRRDTLLGLLILTQHQFGGK